MKRISIAAVLVCTLMLAGCTIETTGTGPGAPNGKYTSQSSGQKSDDKSYETPNTEAAAPSEENTPAPTEAAAETSEPTAEQTQTVTENSYDSGQDSPTEAPATEEKTDATHEAIELPVIPID